MKPHLISTEILARQVFRYSPAYRFAALVLCVCLVAQIPFVAWIAYEHGLLDQRQARAAQLASDTTKIGAERKGLVETERKLKRIQDLAPLLRARLPIGAVLAKIEQLTPPDLSLSRITIDAEAYQPLQIDQQLYHVAHQIRISIEGEQALQAADPEACNHLAQSLLQSLPPESKIAEITLDSVRAERYKKFQLTLTAPTNANYFGLGVTTLASQNSL
jgi:hypothetical protein